jgi:serine protease Do
MRNSGYKVLAGAGVAFLIIAGGPGVAPAQSLEPKPEVETNMQAQDWNRLDDVADQLAGLQAKLSAEMSQAQDSTRLDEAAEELATLETKVSTAIPQALAQAQRRVMDMSPDSNVMFDSEPGGWLGLEISEVNSDSAKEFNLPAVRGVQITKVESDSPAAKAGLKETDVVLTYDGENVEGTVQFRRLVRETPPGRTIPLGVFRSGSLQTVNIDVAERGENLRKVFFERDMRDDETPQSFAFTMPDLPDLFDARTPLLGISAEDLGGQLGAYFGVPDGEGVLVREVKSGTPADKAGVKAGDVITRVDDKPVKSLHELRARLREKRNQKAVDLAIVRKGSEIKIPVAVEKPNPADAPQTLHRAQM